MHAAVAAAHGNQRRRPTDRSSARMKRVGPRIRASQPDIRTRWRRRSRHRWGQTRAAATPPRRDRTRRARTGWPARRPRSDRPDCSGRGFMHHKRMPGHARPRSRWCVVAAEHLAQSWRALADGPPAPPGIAPSPRDARQRVLETLVGNHVLARRRGPAPRASPPARRRRRCRSAGRRSRPQSPAPRRPERRRSSAIAFISRSSLRMTPWNPSSSRSMPWTMRRDSVAGFSSSSDGTSTCAVMMNATPALDRLAERARTRPA